VPASSTGRAGSWPGLLEGYAQTWGPASAARKGSPGVIRRRSKLLEFQGNRPRPNGGRRRATVRG